MVFATVLDADADPNAIAIAFNSVMLAVCNAMETLLIHADGAERIGSVASAMMRIECEAGRARHCSDDAATEADGEEY